jgi:uroporphyrin-III C-methyltransferase/precorrin-2 dehydrogenase/sirohydrochlorin ferrochelatase
LVGAGPGDPELMTRRAARVLGEADLVLYDALVDPRALDLAPQARRFPVGKRAGRPSIRQETINRLMVRAALRGQRVVRLKCGDPFVLGRGGEEALALVAAGVAFEVVPGVSSAVAAAALAGIPVTHRGLAAGFVVVSGHAETAYGPVLDSLAPHSLTVVVLMGLGSRAAVASRLLARGWSPLTPAAVVLGASTEAAHAWTGTLGALATADVSAAPRDREARGREADPPDERRRIHFADAEDAPGTIVVGAVVSLAAVLGRAAETADSAVAVGAAR